jgi:hypothetical protein
LFRSADILTITSFSLPPPPTNGDHYQQQGGAYGYNDWQQQQAPRKPIPAGPTTTTTYSYESDARGRHEYSNERATSPPKTTVK